MVFAFSLDECLAVKYIQPDQKKELFKLEKIPLQVNRLRDLSHQLVVLARREHDGSPEEQRASAQLIALAMRLDSLNQAARETNRELMGAGPTQKSTPGEIAKAKSRIRFFNRWLAQSDAGQEANRLSKLLQDATRVVDAERRNQADLGNWENVVAEINDYPSRPDDMPVDKNEPENKANPEDSDDAEPKSDEPQGDSSTALDPYPIRELSVRTPLSVQKTTSLVNEKIDVVRITSKRVPESEKVCTMKLTIADISKAKINKGDDLLTVEPIVSSRSFRSYESDPIIIGLQRILRSIKRSKHSHIRPAHCKVTISGGKYSRSNKMALSGPIALMLEASAQNKHLRDDLYICARVDADGKLRMPENFWTYIKTLRTAKSRGRLIVPKESLSLLSQILVFDEPDFFTRLEVFAVETLDEALTVAAKKASNDFLKADALFGSVTELAKKTDVTKLAVNRAVRARLTEIVKLSPSHASAMSLLLQGSGKRPLRLSRQALAHNILPTISRMNYVLENCENPRDMEVSIAKKAHEEARAELDPMTRLVDRSSGELFKETLDLANDFRSLYSAIRRVDGSYEDTLRKIVPEYKRMLTKSRQLLEKTRVVAGFASKEDKKDK